MLTTLSVLLGVYMGSMDERRNLEHLPHLLFPRRTPSQNQWKKNKKQALKGKELGNEAYRKKNFDTALKPCNRAQDLEPTNMT